MSGEKTAVEIALAANDAAPATRAEQLDMLGLGGNKKVVSLAQERDAKIGRPRGARNKRTVEWANYLLSRYTSPLEVLAQIASTDTDLLAQSLGCNKLEALQERRVAAMGLAPFVHSKMPIAVDVTNHKIVHLVIGDLGEPAPQEKPDEVFTISGEILSRVDPEEV